MEIEQLNRWMVAGPVIRHLEIDEEQNLALSYIIQNPGLQARRDCRLLCASHPARRVIPVPHLHESRLPLYYDDTRNRSKRYCDDKMCGNLMKVRRFRRRKAQSSNSED